MCPGKRTFVLVSFILCAFAVVATARKTETWPPRILKEYFSATPITTCLERHKPDVKKLEEFELSDDFDHLPDDRLTKCYIYCLWLEWGVMKPDSSFNVAQMVAALNNMQKFEQNIFLKMSTKCNKKFKDPCETAYQINVCMKRNDNEHYYLFYDTEWD